jgi:ribosomal-protein-alanine N-acetyltransferase
MTDWTIVPMAARHAAALAALDARCFSDPWTPEGYEAELSSGTACFFVAERDGEVLGCAGMHCVCGECYVDRVFCSPDCRRRGVARSLMERLDRWARERRAAFITLEVRASNAPAAALYRSFGFEPAGIRRDFYSLPREDAVLMTKTYPKTEDDI